MNKRLLRTSTLVVFVVACRPSAQDDPERWVGGSVTVEERTETLATGALFLTDVIIEGRGAAIFTSTVEGCNDGEQSLIHWVDFGEHLSIHAQHGMRLLVPKGKTLCVRAGMSTNLTWAGFRP